MYWTLETRISPLMLNGKGLSYISDITRAWINALMDYNNFACAQPCLWQTFTNCFYVHVPNVVEGGAAERSSALAESTSTKNSEGWSPSDKLPKASASLNDFPQREKLSVVASCPRLL